VALQVDHAFDLKVMAEAVAAGADSVLADGSSLPYEDNIALVRAARAALGAGVVLEAELGGLAGDEDRAFGATELRTGVLSTLQEQLPAHRSDGENLQGLLGHWNTSAWKFATAALGMLTR
jgi:fructose/tagatose bisphosphate aldolase